MKGSRTLYKANVVTGATSRLAQVSAPITRLPEPRRNLWCVGRNYGAHARELEKSVFKDSSRDTTAWPIFFTKAPETVIGPKAVVRLPGSLSTQIDYEAELTIVIGKGGSRIRDVGAAARVPIEALLGKHVFLSIRVKVAKDWQRDPKQLGRLGF